MWLCLFKGFEACSAQRATKDWMVVDLKCFAMKVKILRRNLVYAAKAGANKVLMNLTHMK